MTPRCRLCGVLGRDVLCKECEKGLGKEAATVRACVLAERMAHAPRRYETTTTVVNAYDAGEFTSMSDGGWRCVSTVFLGTSGDGAVAVLMVWERPMPAKRSPEDAR